MLKFQTHLYIVYSVVSRPKCWKLRCSQMDVQHSDVLPVATYVSSLESEFRLQSYFTTRGLPPIRLGDKPLETHDQKFYFPTEHLPL
jgi:hypothetical protein